MRSVKACIAGVSIGLAELQIRDRAKSPMIDAIFIIDYPFRLRPFGFLKEEFFNRFFLGWLSLSVNIGLFKGLGGLTRSVIRGFVGFGLPLELT